ncbi:hypothetical protein RUM44_009316 [Polyplax serrata]|uniref:Ankyrin repeat domain-containing protein 12 n=1 Tax=Polyplax serrata TaxID=468196 RepID=A0ABR1ASC0_POLSC
MPGSTTASTKSPKNCYVSLIPMSERQQMKLVRQLETCDGRGGNTRNKESLQNRPRSRNCNGRGETPLHKAAIKGDEELVTKLLEEGADPNIPDFAGKEFMYAMFLTLIKAVWLPSSGAGWTPLHEACNHGWYGVALALVQAGASVNATGFDDDTPLHDAAINGHSKLVRLLVDSGADIHFRNKGGKTPCDVAAPGLIPHLLTSHSLEKTDKKLDVRIGDAAQEADATAISERRSTPSQGKVDKSPRVTLRVHPLKKKSGKLKLDENNIEETNKIEYPISMEEKNSKEDVYEFKSSKEATPVRGNSTSPDVEKTNPEPKVEKSGDANAGNETETSATKRTIAEVGDVEEAEDDNKKRKRKEKEGDGKDQGNATKTLASAGRVAAVRNVSSNPEKGSKVGSHVAGKNCSGNATKGALPASASNLNTDRKSPGSPKPATTVANTTTTSSSTTKAEQEQEENKSGSDGEKLDQGPKVPPLKIVIPQQPASEPEQGNRNGKVNASRHHQALPYVVTTNSGEGEKDGQRSRSASPTDSLKSEEKKDPAIGMLSAEDQKNSLHHQRVLRSSHRSGPGGNATENRAQESTTPRSNNGNGQGSGSSSTTSATVANNSNNGNSSNANLSTDNLSPQSQNRTSPLPQGESNPSNNGANGSTSTEGSSASGNSSNFRPNSTIPSNKNNSGSTNTSSTAATEEKTSDSNVESAQVPVQPTVPTPAPVELHPRKRKLKHNKEVKESPPPQVTTERCESAATSTEVHPHDQPVKNCYQLFLDIRKQIERRRKGLFPVQPKPPQGFKDYLMNRCTYVLAGNASTRQIPSAPLPQNISSPMKDLFSEQEKERHRLRLQHVIEKEKLVLSVEQEILRVHGRAARALANQSLPFSACTILKDEEVYNLITPEQEEKDRNARSRYNGRLFLSWLQDVDDKWEKIKEAMLLRHHNEAESLHAVQKMDWEWKMKELGFCEFKSKPAIHDSHVPMVHVSDDFDLLPA